MRHNPDSSHVSSNSQKEQIYLGDSVNGTDSNDGEFNSSGNTNSNYNKIHSKESLISTQLPKTNILDQRYGRLDAMPATSSDTSFHTCEDGSGNSQYEDDKDQTIPMPVDRFPGNRCHEHRSTKDISGNGVGHHQIIARHVPKRDHPEDNFYPPDFDHMGMSSSPAHYIEPSDLHEGERCPRGTLDPPNHIGYNPKEATTLTGYNSMDTKHAVPRKCTHITSASAPSSPKAKPRQKKNTMHKHRHSDGLVTSSEDFAKFQRRLLKPSLSHPSNPKPKTKVFITYANDDKKHLNCVLDMAHFLQEKNIAVAIDVKERRDMAIDKMGWLDGHFHGVHKVIVAISPEYFRTIGGNSGSMTIRPEDVFSEQGLNTLYIYKKMQIELRNRRCQNERFMPVVFRESKATMDHVPTWLQNTLVYYWPEHVMDIVMHAKGCYWYDSSFDS